MQCLSPGRGCLRGMASDVICDLTNRLNLLGSIMQMYGNSLAALPEEVFLWRFKEGMGKNRACS